jgi:hypothetical protein
MKLLRHSEGCGKNYTGTRLLAGNFDVLLTVSFRNH